VMPGYGIGDELGEELVIASGDKLPKLLRTSGRVIDPAWASPSNIGLIGVRIFSEVVQPACERGSFGCAKLIPERCGSQRNLSKMANQYLPI